MEYASKTKAELITEVMQLRKKIVRLEKEIVKPKETKKIINGIRAEISNGG